MTSSGKGESEVDDEIEQIAQRIMSELETASSKDLSDARYARMILRSSDINYIAGEPKRMDGILSAPQLEIEKRAVVKALLLSTWLQRLYFIIRSFFMSLIAAAITFSVVLYHGSLDLPVAVVIGLFEFVVALIITRLFDGQIDTATRKIVDGLARHRTLRDFIMDHF